MEFKVEQIEKLEKNLLYMTIKTFRTKKETHEYGKTIGWKNKKDIHKIHRRFESVWILGSVFKDINTIIIPLYYENINGIQTMKTIKLKIKEEI